MTACEEDGVVGTDRAVVCLDACTITGCKGPAADLSCHAKLTATDCVINECMGGLRYHVAGLRAWLHALQTRGVWVLQERCGCGTAQ